MKCDSFLVFRQILTLFQGKLHINIISDVHKGIIHIFLLIEYRTDFIFNALSDSKVFYLLLEEGEVGVWNNTLDIWAAKS